MTRKLRLTAVMMMACFVSSAASAQGASVAITARVKTICTAEVAGAPAANFEQGLNEIGRIVELCNNVEGYRLVVKHSQMSTGTFWTLDGMPVAVSDTATETVLVDSTIPAYRERQLGLYLTETPSVTGPLILYAEPKGIIF